MADLATLEVVKDLLEQWSDEALTLDARAHRYPDEDASERDVARANAFRECIEDLGAMFPEAKVWHTEGVVPAGDYELPTIYRSGDEIPEALDDEPAGRNVLGLYRRLGLPGWQICRYNFFEKHWEGVRPFLGQPDEWIELPPAPPLRDA